MSDEDDLNVAMSVALRDFKDLVADVNTNRLKAYSLAIIKASRLESARRMDAVAEVESAMGRRAALAMERDARQAFRQATGVDSRPESSAREVAEQAAEPGLREHHEQLAANSKSPAARVVERVERGLRDLSPPHRAATVAEAMAASFNRERESWRRQARAELADQPTEMAWTAARGVVGEGPDADEDEGAAWLHERQVLQCARAAQAALMKQAEGVVDWLARKLVEDEFRLPDAQADEQLMDGMREHLRAAAGPRSEEEG